MIQCNYVLKWRDETGAIIERWCVIKDGTKYLIGEQDEDMMSIGSSRFAMTIGKDSDTSKLRRGMRFLLYDPDGEDVLAYQISKPNTFYNLYNGNGVYRFIMREDQLTKNDNKELMIADYYNWNKDEKQEAINDNAAEGRWI